MRYIIFLIIFLIPFPTYPADLSIDISLNFPSYIETDLTPYQDSPALKLKFGATDYYLWGSCEATERRYLHTTFGRVDIYGIGLGIHKRINNFLFFGELGYYYPKGEATDKVYSWPTIEFWEHFSEAQIVELAGYPLWAPTKYLINDTLWPNYKYHITGDVGFSIGGAYVYPLDDYSDLLFTTAIRRLKFDDNLVGFHPDFKGYWITHHQIDASYISIGISFNHKF